MISEKIIIITAPSGAGKTSITKYLLNKYSNLSFSISAATRLPRKGEVDGKDYYFISTEDFKNKIKNNAFAEWEMVYEGKYYGTLKSELENIWKANKIPVLDIDVKGAIHIQQAYLNKTLSLFIQPPSIAILKERLESRGTETEETIQTRINKAAYEISFCHSFDKIIVNDNLETACKEAEKIIETFLCQS
ncbi:MAG TPA: guanylate kinase [Chitinophagaceae bacterium]|nr:guanylate kinase [Chitinophagaceae bacterium]MCC6636085.1 guanylate kinase [Chitinophagaceae bacterium]HMZ45228.1 guanylate kinase [Chitinophagaceae bacterium]HNE92699.1 guanylate kinase [Chitinophagaceae bacterium]HNM33513.1 guanylate kinase [Chitinophagaceae bacterium]